jgi:ribosomal protein S18 acetylase RimI-like enzyme
LGLFYINYNKKIDELLPHGFISLIATLPELKRKGIGKKLLNQALSNMFHHYGVNVVYGNTDIMNKQGSGMFQSSGFIIFNILTELRRWYGN